MDNHKVQGTVQKVSAAASFFAVVGFYPANELRRAENLSTDQLLAFFFLPALFIIVSEFLPAVTSVLWVRTSRTLLAGFSVGVEAAFVLLGIVVWFAWYENPSNGRLEPLFAAVGIATAAMEGVRRQLVRAQNAGKYPATVPQEHGGEVE